MIFSLVALRLFQLCFCAIRILQKCASVHTTKTMEREAQRQDLRLLKNNQFEINQDLESQREAIFKLTRQIDATEQQLNRV